LSETVPSQPSFEPPFEPSTSWQNFIWQLCTALEIDAEELAPGSWRLVLNEQLAVRWEVSDLVGEFRGIGQGNEATSAQSLDADGELVQRMLTALEDERRVLHLCPVEQPSRVTEVSEAILSAYEVENGRKHLAGCTIDDRPLLRLTFFDNSELTCLHFLPDSKPVDGHLVAGLHLDDVVPHECQREWGTIDDVAFRWIESAKREAGRAGFLSASMVWCKYAIGKVTISVDGQSVEVPFAGWTSLLGSRSLRPPPYKCPETGIESYQLSVDDEGHLTATEAISVCFDTGRRLLLSHMKTCPDTQLTAQHDFFEICAATAEQVHHSAIALCSICQQGVRISQLYHQTCPTCRNLKVLRKVDPTIARILGEYPRLDRWKKWRFAEGKTLCVLVGSNLFHRILLVMDRENLDILRTAKSTRFSRTWTDVEQIDIV
jgi:hypothetical protein